MRTSQRPRSGSARPLFQSPHRVVNRRTNIEKLIGCLAAVLTAAALIATPAAAAPPVLPGNISIDLETVASGLTAPLGLVESPDNTGRKFVVDQAGQIRIIQNGSLLPTPFLNLTGVIPTLNPGFDERGVLGMAFHPDYAQNGRFFVRYSVPRQGAPGEPCFGTSRGCHSEVLSEFTASANPNVANPTPITLLTVPQPQFNHNGGDVHFGPDGMLYMGLGDGGGAHDGLADTPPSHGPIGNGQNTQTLLGSMLRIDVSTPGAYTIPATNPFADGVNGRPEIYAYGLRNPFKFSFDSRPGGTNRLFLADVGQNLVEEVDIIENGKNYGWVTKEGTNCFDPLNPTVPLASCSSTGPMGEPLVDPISEYDHTEGISIIGGFVYRGSAIPALSGMYVFGDFSRGFGSPDGRLFYFDPANPTQIFELLVGTNNDPLGRFLHGFGEDADGELYVLAQSTLAPTGSTGVVLRIVPEPTAMSLLLLGALFTVRRGRRSARSSVHRM